ncbi:YqeG family HAD IIIA-type phosphatase [Solibacillus sp. MA9]|uniref:YqeG family HAD IIIA-type phosphatase n=1 Tax=Solibacillus palustris TaxID=2908203 RepID=A0ABS9UDG7_9BACL|nr:YqeG family HAD IIIA-type phosphatase [Solibacillus sp. MA9]MCH7322185.1 YqeG family HAD IIIA-type phosphatase [Solibacillus sp. MA9]
MYSFLLPNEFVTSIFEVTPEKLANLGIKGIITDLDNTLVEWDRADATEELVAWFDMMREAGIKVIIASNNNEQRVRTFAEPHGIPFIYRAKKPLGKAYYDAMVKLRLNRNEVAMLGDQLLTDVMGAKRQKIYTFLVRPVADSDGLVTKFNRFVERRVYNDLKRKGQYPWGD